MKAPSLLKRASFTIVYNLILSAILFPAFGLLYTIDDVARHLDNLTMFGLYALTPDFFVCLTLFWFAFRQVFKDINLVRFLWKSREHELEIVERGAKVSYEGAEGTGKTLNVANDTLMIACQKDEEMRMRYFKKLPFREELLANGDVDFKVLEESFLYFERNEQNIPHLMTNFTLVYNGQKNYPFHMDYLDQKRRLAEGFALGLTEVGNDLPNAWSRIPGDEKKDIHNLRTKSETLSLSRQYFDLTITYDEQRTGEVFLGLRALNSENRSLKRRENILEPKFLLKILEMLENKKLAPLGESVVALREELFDEFGKLILLNRKKIDLYHKQLKKLKKVSIAHSRLQKLINRIGFYVFTYDLKESQDATKKLSEDLTFVLPKYFPFKFDTRGLRYNYKLYSKKPDFLAQDN